MIYIIGDAKTFKKLHTFPGGRKGVKNFDGHTQDILCLAISFDGQYLASGGLDKVINIWSVKEDKHIVKFTQHRDAISVSSFSITMCISLIPLFFSNRALLSVKAQINYILHHTIVQSSCGILMNVHI